MISHRYRAIFIHIPKTGGASIERLIWSDEEKTEDNLWMGYTRPHHNKYQSGALQHLWALNVMKAVGAETYRDYYTFAMVRNPWDRVISQYLYLQKRWDLRKFLGVPRHLSFVDYLGLIIKHPHVHWESQCKFVYDADDQILVDKIYRYEEFDESVRSILVQIGAVRPQDEIHIPHANKSERKAYYYYYDDYTRDMVAEIYHDDISRFDYAFDDERYVRRGKRHRFPVPRHWLASKWYELTGRVI